MIRLQDTYLRDILKTFWRRFEDVWTRRIYWSWPIRLLKTSTCDVYWRRMISKNIFIFIKTSFKDEDERRLQDVFIKTNVCWAIFQTKVSAVSQKISFNFQTSVRCRRPWRVCRSRFFTSVNNRISNNLEWSMR